jgi:hypothetical protein
MKESCCQFGEDRHLAGIMTEAVDGGKGTVILVNAGLIPKRGPFRLYAELARRLSRAGFSTLRFDLGGIGDSLRNSAGQPLKTRTELEIRAALDYVEGRYGPANLVLGGLCSGAEDSFRFAEIDSRVTGVVMIDSFGYPMPGWAWRNFLHRAVRRSRRALGLYHPYPHPKVSAPVGSQKGKPLVSYEYMSHAESSRILQKLVNRGTRVHFIYTGGASGVFNHESQLKAMFAGIDFRDLVTLDHFPHMDHTQVLAEHRRTLVESITGRLTA